MICTREQIIKNRDLANIVGSDIKVKEFFETRDTIDKSMSIVKSFLEVRKLKSIYEFTSGHTFSGLYALSRNHCNNVVSIDLHFPKSAIKIQSHYPRLLARFETREEDIYRNNYTLPRNSAVISIHPCGNLSYRVCDIAIENKAPIVIVPCCIPKGHQSYLDKFEINKHLKHELKIANYLAEEGYKITVKKIIQAATPRNTIIIGIPNL